MASSKEADEIAGEIEDKPVLDAPIVANAQAVEHYEMCRYGTLIAWAEELGQDDIVRFLTTNLNEEKVANTKLNTVALRKGVNAKASDAARSAQKKSSSAAPRHRGASVSLCRARAQFAPSQPAGHGGNQPGQRCTGEGARHASLDENPEHCRKGQHAKRAQRSAGGIQCRGLLATPLSFEAGLLLAPNFMGFDEGRAGAEDRRQREKETADRGAVAAADEAGEYGRGATESEAHEVLVPAALSQR